MKEVPEERRACGPWRASTKLVAALSLAASGCFPSFDGLNGATSDRVESALPDGAIGAADGPREETSLTDGSLVGDEHASDAPTASGDGSSACQGYALKLDGTGYGKLVRLIQDDFTVEVWIQATTSIAGQVFFQGSGLITADVQAPNADDFSTWLLSDKFVAATGNPDTSTSSKSVVTTGQWVHLAATRVKATGEVHVFVNGVAESSVTGNTHSLSGSSVLNVGGRSSGNRYIGLLEEVRLWNKVRSSGEITATMHHRLTGNEPGLVGYYRFDENGGDVGLDASPSGNDMMFNGPVAWVVSDAPICEDATSDL
jgi:hypothetical protein